MAKYNVEVMPRTPGRVDKSEYEPFVEPFRRTLKTFGVGIRGTDSVADEIVIVAVNGKKVPDRVRVESRKCQIFVHDHVTVDDFELVWVNG